MLMNVVQAMRDYIRKIVRTTTGMKVFLLDKETTGMVSVAYSLSEIMQEEIYIFEDIRNRNREFIGYLKAIVFLRPTKENLSLLKEELRTPKYGEYYLFFSNTIPKDYLYSIASADEYEVVCEVQEVFGDYFALNSDLFSLNLPSCLSSKEKDWGASLRRMEDGLFSIFCSLQINPFIRIQRSSVLAKEVSDRLLIRMRKDESLLSTKNSEPTILLIIDRKDDPVTPLLGQWTYQAMLHGFLGINNNLVELKPSEDTQMPRKLVVSSYHDSFYRDNLYKDFGKLGDALKKLTESYREKTALYPVITSGAKTIESFEDIITFLSVYPDINDMKTLIAKHLVLTKEIERIIDRHKHLDVSAFEQTLACSEEQKEAMEILEDFIRDDSFLNEDVLRLVILYSLRYEGRKDNHIEEYLDMLSLRGLSRSDTDIIRKIHKYGGIRKRSKQNDLFSNQNGLSLVKEKIKTRIMGIPNLYMQHQPLIQKILQRLIDGNLDEETYPYTRISALEHRKPQKIVVFIIGGATYEEARIVNYISAAEGISILLGGSTIHNADSFLSNFQS